MSFAQQLAMTQMNIAGEWPQDAQLYQPLEEKQILLTESAPCLAVQVYMHMCNLQFEVITKENAEFMLPGGALPILKCGKMLISSPTSIISFLKQKGYTLAEKLSENQKYDVAAYVELVNSVLVPAELFVTWIDDSTYRKITCNRYGSPYDWPLNLIMCWRKRREVARYLEAIGWKQGKKTMPRLEDDLQRCCLALSEKLGDKEYFFGDRPTELDALVFGHLFTILTTRLPDNRLAETVRKFDNLVSFCQNIDRQYFGADGADEISD